MRPRRARPWTARVLACLLAGVAAGCADETASRSAGTSATTRITTAAPTTVAPTTAPATAAAAPAATPTRSPTPAPASTTTATSTTVAPAPPADTGSGRYPPQPAGVPWPTVAWRVASPPPDVDVAAIDAVADAAFGAPDATARLRAVLVVHGGAIVYERYHPLDGPQTVFASYSVAKSVTAALTGMLVDDGVLDPAAPAPVPEWQAPGDPRAAITLDHLLRMSSGLRWSETYGVDDLPWQMFRAEHAADVPLSQPLVAEPGTVWNYSTGTSAIITDVLADALGGPDALDAFIRDRLMAPLGIRSTVLLEDPTGTFLGGVGFDSTARDFARFALLHLRGGMWDGERLLSEAWIDRTRTPSPTNPRYGAHWWLLEAPGTFSAQGLFGQQIVVDVEHDLVVVATATAGGDSSSVVRTILDQFTSG